MKSPIYYRILTYPLLLVAGFLAFGVIVVLPTALANPVLLLSVFLVACIVIYTYTSWRFLIKGIDQQMPLKHSLRDLIKVNSYCSIVFAALCLIQAGTLTSNPELIRQAAKQAMSAPGAADATSEEAVAKAFKGLLIFLAIYSVLLLVHVIMTLRLLKPYRYLFEQQPKEPKE